MLTKVARMSALAFALAALTVPANRLYASSNPPKVVTGGDPQPTGEVVMRTIVIFQSLIVL